MFVRTTLAMLACAGLTACSTAAPTAAPAPAGQLERKVSVTAWAQPAPVRGYVAPAPRIAAIIPDAGAAEPAPPPIAPAPAIAAATVGAGWAILPPVANPTAHAITLRGHVSLPALISGNGASIRLTDAGFQADYGHATAGADGRFTLEAPDAPAGALFVVAEAGDVSLLAAYTGAADVELDAATTSVTALISYGLATQAFNGSAVTGDSYVAAVGAARGVLDPLTATALVQGKPADVVSRAVLLAAAAGGALK